MSKKDNYKIDVPEGCAKIEIEFSQAEMSKKDSADIAFCAWMMILAIILVGSLWCLWDIIWEMRR